MCSPIYPVSKVEKEENQIIDMTQYLAFSSVNESKNNDSHR